MSKTQYYCAASLDGYIAEADDTLGWLLNYEGSFDGEHVEPGPMSDGGSYARFYEGDVQIVDAKVSELYERMMAAADGRNLWVVGGGNVASQFADEGLLDEVLVTVVPVVLGSGKPLFDRRLPSGAMQLLGTRTFDTGMVELRYEVKR